MDEYKISRELSPDAYQSSRCGPFDNQLVTKGC